MALDVELGQANIPTATGDQIITTTFQPKAIVLFSGGHNDGDGGVADLFQMIGMATATTEAGVSNSYHVDAQTTSAVTEYISVPTTNAVYRDRRDGTENAIASFVSVNATPSFTINWSYIRAAWKSDDFFWIAFGGSDLTNAKVVTWTAPTTATTKDVDVGFTPDFILPIHWHYTTIGGKSGVQQCIGAATDPTEEWVVGQHGDDGVSTTDCGMFVRNDCCVQIYNATGSSLLLRADLDSWLSGATDGFRLDYTTASGVAALAIALCLKGGSYYCGTDSAKTSTTGTKATTGVGFQGKLGIFAGWRNGASLSRLDHTRLHFGAATSSTNRVTLAALSENGVTTSDASSYQDQVHCIRVMTEGGASPTTDASADFDSWDSDGFTLDWDDVDATAYNFGFAIFGDADTGVTASALIAEADGDAYQPTGAGTGSSGQTGQLATGIGEALQPTGSGSGTVTLSSNLAESIAAAFQSNGSGSGSADLSAALASGVTEAFQSTAQATGSADIVAQIATVLAEGFQPTGQGTGTATVSGALASAQGLGITGGGGGTGSADLSAQIALATAIAFQATTLAGGVSASANLAEALGVPYQVSGTGTGSADLTAQLALAIGQALQADAAGTGTALLAAQIAEALPVALQSAASIGGQFVSAQIAQAISDALEGTGEATGAALLSSQVAEAVSQGFAAAASGTGTAQVSSQIADAISAALQASASGSGSLDVSAVIAQATSAALQSLAVFGGLTVTANLASSISNALQAEGIGTSSAIVLGQIASGIAVSLQAIGAGSGAVDVAAQVADATASVLQANGIVGTTVIGTIVRATIRFHLETEKDIRF